MISSSASEEMETSKQPNKLLELGDFIVKQLDLHDSVDTLSRWMSHHLAELIELSKTEQNTEKKQAYQKEAEQLIIKLWERKASVPNGLDPMERYQSCMNFISQLTDQPAIVNIIFPNQKPKKPVLPAILNLMRNHRLSFRGLIAMNMKESEPVDNTAYQNLSEDEQALVSFFEELASDFKERGIDPEDATVEHLSDLRDSCSQLIEALQEARGKPEEK